MFFPEKAGEIKKVPGRRDTVNPPSECVDNDPIVFSTGIYYPVCWNLDWLAKTL